MLDISLGELTELLGTPTRRSGHQYYFRCPACASSGNDTHGDNLLYNDAKGLLKCFACDEGAVEVLRLINERRGNVPINKTQNSSSTRLQRSHIPWYESNKENLYQYMFEANSEMPSYITQYLWREYGIDSATIEECAIGYDSEPNMVNIGTSIVFPMFSLNHNLALVGFELRQIGADWEPETHPAKKVIRHTIDSPSCICVIHGSSTATRLIICEGFKDAYCMKQYLQRFSKHYREYMICTPAHGCNDILHNLYNIPLSQFSKYYLVLDNDQAGDQATMHIKKQYPFFVDKRSILQNYKDVCDFWRTICY